MKQLNYADPYWVEEFETRCYKTEALSFKDQSHLNASKYSPQPTVSKPQQILRAFYKRILMNTKINFPNSQKSFQSEDQGSLRIVCEYTHMYTETRQ